MAKPKVVCHKLGVVDKVLLNDLRLMLFPFISLIMREAYELIV